MSQVIDTPTRFCDGRIDLRLGDYRQVLHDVEEGGAVITDPPYSPRQGEGFRSHNDFARRDGARSRDVRINGTITYVQGMPYAPMSEAFADDLVGHFIGAGPSWFVIFGDHISFRWWEAALSERGWYVFAPVVWVRGNAPRFQGDGPSSAAEYIAVARPRRKTACGSLPGLYLHPPLKARGDRIVTGQKPVALMRAIIRDYTNPGDLVVDPCAGGATTLLAAAIEGRRAIGAERDEATFRKAVKRIKAGYTVRMAMPALPKPKQAALL